jgi:diadenosine tetraphosphatase ApaH/serine/threonine PP2A family protein phosphatase
MDHRAYIGDLPALTTVQQFVLAHGSPRSPIWEYVTTAQVATENFDCFEGDICFIGHTHIAMFAVQPEPGAQAEIHPFRPGDVIDLSAGRFIINPGSVGQPRDRDPRAAYAILDTAEGTVTAHRVEYDYALTQRQMALANLPEVLIARLSHGM